MVDLDHFKAVNDTFGHPGGDAALAAAARALRTYIRGSDVARRFGGEEFVVLLPATDRRRAAAVAERIRATVAALEVPTGCGTARVTASVGVSTLAAGIEESLEVLLGRADAALYTAKNAGRDRVEIAARAVRCAACGQLAGAAVNTAA